MRQKTLILASASPRRKELLEQIGLIPRTEPSQVEEIITQTAPEQVVMELSRQKARDVAVRFEGQDVMVLGADTVVTVDGEILGKPKNSQDAARMIAMLAGRSHQVYTGVTLVDGGSGKETTFYEETEVFVFPMSQEEIDAYVTTGESLDKAGAYGIQGRFAAFVQGIRGDYTNVVGLPVGRVWQELKRL